jgi:hypothetical protein
MNKKILFFFVCLFFAITTIVSSQKLSQEELEKAIQNPIANLVSLPIQNNADFGVGNY